MNEGFSRLLQRADCRKNAPHRNAGQIPRKKPPPNPTKTAIDPKNHPNRRISPIRMFRRRKNTPHRNAEQIPRKTAARQIQPRRRLTPKNHPNREPPIRMAYFDYRPVNSAGSSNRSVPSGCGKAS